jgi:hypothetical protein
VGARNEHDIVAKIFEHGSKVHGDHGLVFDNQDVGADLLGDFTSRLIDQRLDVGDRHFQNRRDLVETEPLHRAQQEGDARQRCHGLEVARRSAGCGRSRRLRRRKVEWNRAPDFQEYPVESGTRVKVAGQHGTPIEQRLQCRGGVSITAWLAAGQCPGEASEIRHLRHDCGRHGHVILLHGEPVGKARSRVGRAVCMLSRFGSQRPYDLVSSAISIRNIVRHNCNATSAVPRLPADLPGGTDRAAARWRMTCRGLFDRDEDESVA